MSEKFYCKKHKKWSDPYIVCSHVANDGEKNFDHIPFDGISGQIMCFRGHYPPGPGDKPVVIMCAFCVEEMFLAERKTN